MTFSSVGKIIFWIGLFAVLVVAGYVVSSHFFPALPASVSFSPSVTPAPPVQIATPTKLIIPSINVNASVESLGLTAQGAVAVPAGPYDVAWFDVGPEPGELGSAVISGHFGPWKDGAQSVFNNLSELKPGDAVEVQDANGKILTFIVQGSEVLDAGASAPELFTKNDKAYLNLITCNGDWEPNQKTYTKRLVVFTQLQTS